MAVGSGGADFPPSLESLGLADFAMSCLRFSWSSKLALLIAEESQISAKC